MEVIGIANQKGGVGKTTTAVTLGGLLAQQGERVLLVDTDPHAGLSYYFGIESETLENSIYDVFVQGKQQDVPIIVGFNGDEAYPFRHDRILNKEAYLQDVKKQYGKLADEYLAVYPADDWKRSTERHSGYAGFGWTMEGVARMMERVSSEAYLYFFDHN